MSDNKLYFCQESLDYANPFDCCNECHCENKKEQILCRKRVFLESQRTIIGMYNGCIELDWDKYQNAVDFIINHIDRLEWKDGNS